MKNPCREYKMSLETIGPVFVGDGKTIDKKSYLYTDAKHIEIIDLEKMYNLLQKKGHEADYEKYLLSRDRNNLKEWLAKYNVSQKEIDSCVKYKMDCGAAIDIKHSPSDIQQHIKDPYGNPYIPGSSIKGMIRTIMLAYDIINNPEKYSDLKDNLEKILFNSNGNVNRKYLLKNEMSSIEVARFNTCERNKKKKEDAVNDIMSGIIVSDSESIDIDNLVLCKKIDGSVRGNDNPVKVVLRECVKPGVRINFTITVDETVDDFDIDKLFDAVSKFANCYNECFVDSFINAKPIQKDYVVIGGGSGFVSKTIMYPLLGKKDGVRAVREVLLKTIKPMKGKHPNYNDSAIGISPHTIKYTRYGGKTLQMGVCRLIEREI